MANYYDYTYDDDKNPKYVYVWEQDYETNKIVKKKYDVKKYLYFYVDSINGKGEENIISQLGTIVNKVRMNDYKRFVSRKDAIDFNDQGLFTYESDIAPIDKCIMDEYGDEIKKMPKWNIALYDIETDIRSEMTFEEMRQNADAEITAISVWFSNINESYCLTVVPPYLRDMWDKDEETRSGSKIIYFDNEKDLLDTFFYMIKKNNIMAVGAWNADFFDSAYIYNRTRRYYSEEETGKLMGRFKKIKKQKVERGDKEDTIIRPIGTIWFDYLEVYKKNGQEMESYALNFIVENELGLHKVDFDGDFEYLYHGSRQDRKFLDEIFEGLSVKKKLKIIKKAMKIGKSFEDEFYDDIKKEVMENEVDDTMSDGEIETRIQLKLTEFLTNMYENDNEIQDILGDDEVYFQIYLTIKRLLNNYRLFLDYSIQDTDLLKKLELKLNKFNTLMMLSQYNVCHFYDVFSTVRQMELGITNFAHRNNNIVVIDRDYRKDLMPYNKYVDPVLLELRINKDYEIRENDDEKIREYKKLLAKSKIPGAHVLQPIVGLVSVDDKTPEIAKKYKEVKSEYDAILEEMNKIEELLYGLED